MACNENVIKNMANEITRNCHASNIMIQTEFVIYLVELLLINPKYGKMFAKTLDRNDLHIFVEKCVNVIVGDTIPLSTLKLQFIIHINYDKIKNLLNYHTYSIACCLYPVLNEILEEYPDLNDEMRFAKLFRKISLYIILSSGLGNPTNIDTIKEGLVALESVFSIEDLKILALFSRAEKLVELSELVEVVSGMRLFNRECKKGGEEIPDLPYYLVDAGKTCIGCLSNSLICVMQRVNTLTTAIENAVIVDDETGNVEIHPLPDLTLDDYRLVFNLLAFNRQYEIIIRRFLSDVERTVKYGTLAIEKYKVVLEEIHQAVKYKAAVPIITVFPLFSRLWQTWRSMQNVMFIVTRVAQLMTTLSAIDEHVEIPSQVIQTMRQGRRAMTDQDRMNCKVGDDDLKTLQTLENYVPCTDIYYIGMKDPNMAYLGFCAMCLSVGALVPSNMRLGSIKINSRRFGFCSVKMAIKFSKDPTRYINEILDHARNNQEIIHLLKIGEEVRQVKDINCLVTKHFAKIKVSDQDVQTETHPIKEYIEKNYTWDLWEWKRRACQWASIVNCQTHSTQTNHSHLRSEVHCQTFEIRHKKLQTKKDTGVNTQSNNVFLWGLRGQLGSNQHVMELGNKSISERKKAHVIAICHWPCIGSKEILGSHTDEDDISVNISVE